MIHYVNNHPEMGNMLWLEEGNIQIGIALDYGIRVRHLSRHSTRVRYTVSPFITSRTNTLSRTTTVSTERTTLNNSEPF